MKKVLLIGLLSCWIAMANSATRTISVAGGNYNSTTTWVEGVVPTSSDDVIATDSSGALFVNVPSVAKTLVLTGYLDSLVLDANLTISGNINLASGMSYLGSANLICSSTATLTSHGITITGGLQLNGTSQTFTLTDNWLVNGLLTCGGTTATTINGNTLTCNGGYTQTNVTTVSGTTSFVLSGGTWTSALNTNVLRNNLSFAGNVSLGSNVAYNTGTLTHTSGTINTAGSTLTCVVGSVFNCSSIAWNNVVFGGTSQTFTLNADLDVNGTFTCNGTTATTINGAYSVKIGGNYTQVNVLLVSGTATFLFDGKGTWSGGSTLALRNNLTINTTDTLTINSGVAYNTGTLTHTAGTVVASGSTLTCNAGTTFNCAGVSWNDLVFGGTSQTFTLNAHLDINGAFTCNGTTATTINGAYNVKIGGNYTQTNVVLVSGTATFLFDGKGTWAGGSTLVLRNNLTINTTDTITINSNVAYNTGTLTYTAGVVITSGSTLTVISGTIFNCSGIAWNNMILGGTSQTFTLSADLDVNGLLTCNGTTTTTINGAYNLKAGGSYAQSVATVLGTATFLFDGKGTWGNSSTGGMQINTVINTTDTLILSASIIFGGSKTLTYTAGVLNAFSSTLVLGTCTVNLNATTPTFAAISVSGSTIFGGTYGWNAGNFYSNTPGSTTTFASGKTYSITGGITVTATSASKNSFVSSTANTAAIINLATSATEDIAFCNLTDITSTGLPLWTYKGTVTRGVGVSPLKTEPQTISYTF